MSDIDHEAIRKRVEKRVKKRQEFATHLLSFVLVNGLLWVIYLILMPGQFMWPLIVMGGWGIGLIFHALDTYYQTSTRPKEQFEREVDREIELERRRRGITSEKPKRDQNVRLTADGELDYGDEDAVDDGDEDDYVASRKRNRA